MQRRRMNMMKLVGLEVAFRKSGFARLRPGRLLVAMVILAYLLPGGIAGKASVGGYFCNGDTPIRELGTSTHADVWQDHFMPWLQIKFQEEAAKPHDSSPWCAEPSGLLAYDSVGDEVATEAAVFHRIGNHLNPHLLYGVDLPLSADEWALAWANYQEIFRTPFASQINHFPTFVHAVAVGYNLSSCNITAPLKLSSRQLSLIYSGLITNWSDPLLVLGETQDFTDDNLSLGSCNLGIDVAIPVDTPASTVTFKEYLRQQNPAFNAYTPKEMNTSWPTTLVPRCRGLASDGGMSTCLSVPGRIAYVIWEEARFESTYDIAYLRNASGQFVAPASNVSHQETRVMWPDNCPAAQNDLSTAGLSSGQSAPTSTTQDWSRVTLTGVGRGYPMCQFALTLLYQMIIRANTEVSHSSARSASDLMTIVGMDDVQASIPSMGVSYLTPSFRQMVRTGVSGLTG